MVKCDGCDVECLTSLCCPKCLSLDRQSFFCTQLCFESSWMNHSKTHTKNFTGSNPRDSSCISEKIVQRIDPSKTKHALIPTQTELHLPDNSVNNFKTLNLYDPETNASLSDIENHPNIGKWLMESAMKLSHTLDMTEDLHNTKLHLSKSQLKGKFDQEFKNFSSHKIKRSTRRVIVTVVFALVLLVAYTCSIKLVNIMEERNPIKYGNMTNSTNIDELSELIEDMQIELKNLREIVYNNAIAINGLNSNYKVPGNIISSEQAKKNKFGKNAANLNNKSGKTNINNQQTGDTHTTSTGDFVPNSIEYNATVSIQS